MRSLLLLSIGLFISLSSQAQLFKTYKEGSYYDKSGTKHSGLVSFLPYAEKIHFKAEKGASSNKIDIKDISAVIINQQVNNDSLIVLTEDNKADQMYFAKLLVKTPAVQFYYKFRVASSGGVPTMSIGAAPNMGSSGSQPAFHNTYTWSSSPSYFGTQQILMYTDGESTYRLTKKNFVEVLTKALAGEPDLVQQVQEKKYKFRQVEETLTRYLVKKS